MYNSIIMGNMIVAGILTSFSARSSYMELLEILERPVDNHLSLVWPWHWHHEHLRRETDIDMFKSQTTSNTVMLINAWNQLTLSLGVRLWTAPIMRALITKRCSLAIVGTSDHHTTCVTDFDRVTCFGLLTLLQIKVRKRRRRSQEGSVRIFCGNRGVAGPPKSRQRRLKNWKNAS